MTQASRNPRHVRPNTDPSLGPIDRRRTPCGARLEPSLADELGEVADDLRQLYTDFGMRPYRIFAIVVTWDGGEVGKGTQSVLRETELLPTPLIDMSSIKYQVTTGGRSDSGETTVYEISSRYTEFELKEMFPRELRANEQSFLEVRMDGRDGKEPLRHRFTIVSLPARDPDGFQFTMRVMVQFEERQPNGRLSERQHTLDPNPLTLGMPSD